MTTYRPFWETLLKKNMTTYELIYKQGIPTNTIHRMKHGEAITTKTIDELCSILGCEVSEVIEYKKDE